MTITARFPEQKKLEVIDAVAAFARERLFARQGEGVEAFVRRYYAGVSAEDLYAREVPDLYGAALGHFGLLRERRPAELKLRVYNPGFEEHGWQSTHTVVEMVTDDMRFLVDSLVMELNRHGATIHLMVHPILHVLRDAKGLPIEIAGPTTKDARAESVIHVEIDRETGPGEIEVLRDDLCRVLADVRTAVEDWPVMRAALARAIETFSSAPSRVLPDHPVEELHAFLEWPSCRCCRPMPRWTCMPRSFTPTCPMTPTSSGSWAGISPSPYESASRRRSWVIAPFSPTPAGRIPAHLVVPNPARKTEWDRTTITAG